MLLIAQFLIGERKRSLNIPPEAMVTEVSAKKDNATINNCILQWGILGNQTE